MGAVGNSIMTFRAHFGFFPLGQALVSYLALSGENTGLLTGLALGPVIGRWNKYLEFRFPLRSRKDSATSFTALSKKVVVDQIFMAPIGVCLHRTIYAPPPSLKH
jgi:hypothetical protein